MGTFRDAIRVWFGSPASKMRGMPAPLGADEKRPYPEMKYRPQNGMVARAPTPAYDRGIDSYAWAGGQIDYDPIGAGVVSTAKLPIHQGDYKPGAYVAGAIFWNLTPQAAAVSFGTQPQLMPIYDPATLYALLGPVYAQAVAPIPAQPLEGPFPVGPSPYG